MARSREPCVSRGSLPSASRSASRHLARGLEAVSGSRARRVRTRRRSRADRRARRGHRQVAHADLKHQIAEAVAVERALAGEALERDDAERPEVGAVVDRLVALSLLGAHVVRRAEDRAGARRACPPPSRRALDLGDAEVEHLGDLVVLVADEEDVLRLEIAVHDARLVRALQRARDCASRMRAVSAGERRVEPVKPLRRGSRPRAAPSR